MKSRLIKVRDIAALSGLSIATIKNYVNGGYYTKNGFVAKDVGFPKPAKIINKTWLFEESQVRRFFNLT